jgi:hypothetical protein
MNEKCRNCDDKQACVPFFVHEGIMDHYSRANRRMLIALLTVCITFIITIVIFTTSYTKREANWLETLQRVGVTDGVHEQPDP